MSAAHELRFLVEGRRSQLCYGGRLGHFAAPESLDLEVSFLVSGR